MEYFIFYALLFRLAVLLLGAYSLFLGYRLFVKGVTLPNDSTTKVDAQKASRNLPELTASYGNFNLSFKNAAPGAMFALFGAAIVIFILHDGNPEYELSIDKGEPMLKIRGQPDKHSERRNSLSVEDQERLRPYIADLAQHQAIQETAYEPILGIASIYFENGWYDSASTLTSLILALDVDNLMAKSLKEQIDHARSQ